MWIRCLTAINNLWKRETFTDLKLSKQTLPLGNIGVAESLEEVWSFYSCVRRWCAAFNNRPDTSDFNILKSHLILKEAATRQTQEATATSKRTEDDTGAHF